MLVDTRPAARSLGHNLIRSARTPRLRTHREFAEAEIVIPSGPFQGRRFNCGRQPYAELWFALLESHAWRRFFAVGPQQSGKTLLGSVIPVMYHLFEVGETIIYGVPTLDMAADKWHEDILPAIEASRFKDLLPTSGLGSRGAFGTSIRFKHGPTLKFMSGGGGDKSRAGFTARVAVITETDGFDEIGGKSREADKFSQIEGRLGAFGSRSRVYAECTVSIETGRTWREVKGGTDSRIVRPCPHCRAWVTPEREHLIGWQDATSEPDARAAAAFACPACGVPWTEEERFNANTNAKVVHRGQEVAPDGTINGAVPATETLGFRWTAADNHLKTAGDAGAAEWKAIRSGDADNAEKALRQWWWALPVVPDREAVGGTTIDAVLLRAGGSGKGIVPHDAEFVTVGLDLGDHVCWWTAVAWRPDASPHVLDYGSLEVPKLSGGLEISLLAMLRTFRDGVCEEGWASEDGEIGIKPQMVLIDSGNGRHTQPVYSFVRESAAFDNRYWSFKGYGASQDKKGGSARGYHGKGNFKGEHYHIVKLDPPDSVWLVEADSDWWKTWLHQRVNAPAGGPGSLSLYKAERGSFEHMQFAKHLTAEQEETEYVPGVGYRGVWHRVNRQNHFLDSTYMACVAGHRCGARLIEGGQSQAAAPQKSPIGDETGGGGFTTPDGRPFLVTQRR